MLTASQLRKENIAEYLLYMWQLEDMLRACNLDINIVKLRIVDVYPTDESTKQAMLQWYNDLIDMILIEGVKENGHLQINNNILIELEDLHHMLLKSTKYPQYGSIFYQTLPIIVELRAKSGKEKSGEIETCFNALYGVMMMRLRKMEVSESTTNAISQISKYISELATYYHKDKVKPLFEKENYE